MPAVIITPGMAKSSRPTAVREMTRSETPSPPWKRISATPMVKRSDGPTPSIGTSTRLSRVGPAMMPATTSTTMLGSRSRAAMGIAIRPTARTMPIVRRISSTSMRGLYALACRRRTPVWGPSDGGVTFVVPVE